jgi:hypothetical protein
MTNCVNVKQRNIVIASEAKQSKAPQSKYGLLRRGACHRARIRATRWLLAMTSSHSFAISQRDAPELLLPRPALTSEGAGNAGR